MKKIFVFLSLILLFAFIGLVKIGADTISFSIGEIESQETIIVEDITYNNYVLSTLGSSSHIIHNLEVGRYSEFDVVLHDKLYGPDSTGLSTVLEIALDYEAKTGKVVYAAVNGDFFSFDSFLPVGFYGVDNNLLQIGNYNLNSFGFTDAHKTKVGDVEYGYKINIYDSTGKYVDFIHIDKINDLLENGEIGVFTNDISSSISGSNIAKLSVTDELILNNSYFHYEGDLISNINDFVFDDNTYTITGEEFVIAAKGDSEAYQTLLAEVTNDSRLAIYPYPINDWEDMDYIIGGYQILLNRGTKLPEPIHGAETSRHPRTTIAVNRAGDIGLTVIDGRMVNIPGVTLGELADINEDLGYYTALELDGGGSSTCLLRNLETDELEIMNTPSDGHLRGVANAVLIVGDPITDPLITTEETTTQITTVMTTTGTTMITDTAQTSIETTTEPFTFPTSTEAIITTTTDKQTSTTATVPVDSSDCGSCNSVKASTILLSLLAIIGFFFARKKS